MDVSSLAKMRVSLLKFEPRVSNFPKGEQQRKAYFLYNGKKRLECVKVEKDGRKINITIFLPSLLFY